MSVNWEPYHLKLYTKFSFPNDNKVKNVEEGKNVDVVCRSTTKFMINNRTDA